MPLLDHFHLPSDAKYDFFLVSHEGDVGMPTRSRCLFCDSWQILARPT